MNWTGQTLYEATLKSGDVLARADILVRNKDGSWDLIEVKARPR